MSTTEIKQLIAQRVADAMATHDNNRTGSSQNRGGAESNPRGCSIKSFLGCQPRHFNGTEGAIGLTR